MSGSADKDIKFWEFERESTSASYIVVFFFYQMAYNTDLTDETPARGDKDLSTCANP